MRPTWLQREAERCLPEGTRCLYLRRGRVVYPGLDASWIKIGRREAAKARAKRERRLYGPAQDGKAYMIGALPPWW